MAMVQRIEVSDGTIIAYERTPGKGPGVIFLGGFMSDMTGSKATALEAHCRSSGRAFVRFDYLGHGQSSGAVRDGTIGRWLEDSLLVFDRLTEGAQIVIGSSMGSWLALLLTLARPDRVKALIGIGSAPDFTRELMWPNFSEDEKRQLLSNGFITQPSYYSPDPYVISYRLIEEADRHLLLNSEIAIDCPVRLYHGLLDHDVPWQLAHRLMERLRAEDVTLTLVKNGDHRLSSPADITRLIAEVDALAVL
ncbi:MAG: alpha/beta hydrolase [Sphingomonadales bacterium]|nr:alpha/beta hydrolase [Sphingomonadales bacterium]